MGTRALVAAFALATAALVGGCATGRAMAGQEDLTAAQAAPPGAVIVHVADDNWQDVDVFAIRNGQRVRLGLVTSQSASDFRLPAYFLVGAPTVQLFIHPIGSSGGYTSESLLISVGQTVDMHVENNLNLTSYSVR
jgi:hypothetical protein